MAEDTRGARKHLLRGLQAWGFRGPGKPWGPQDADRALAEFRAATDADPGMCDAWLGRWAFHERDRAIPRRMLESVGRLGQDLARHGLEPWSFRHRFDVDHIEGLSTGLAGAEDVWLLEAAQRLQEGDARGAGTLLELGMAPSAMWRYVQGLAYREAWRWGDVLDVASPGANDADEAAAVGNNLNVGAALAQLGYFHEARARLDAVRRSDYSGLRHNAMYLLGLVARAEGDEQEAQRILQALFAETPGDAAVAEAMHDAGFGLLVTTREQIALREDPWDPESAPDVDADAAAEDAARRRELLDATLAELDAEIGLDAVKRQVRLLVAQAQLAEERAQRGLTVERRPRHLIFEGPPGTGKTTIARIVARIYYALGLLATDRVTETSRADFVGEYVGQTAPKADALIDSALDGVLFIDEAYTLHNPQGLSGGDAFGLEAVGVLLARMENDRDRLLVVIAGYPDEIQQFLESNAGLESRFPTRLSFERYDAAQLARIAEKFGRIADAPLTADAVRLLETGVSGLDADRLDRLGNARLARELVGDAIEQRDARLFQMTAGERAGLTDDQFVQVTDEDVAEAMRGRGLLPADQPRRSTSKR